jgi:mono/diheme cytochrome c family protein
MPFAQGCDNLKEIAMYSWISVYSLILLGVPAAAAPPVDFDREIRTVLSDKCFSCHGPDEKQRMAKLRLDTKDGAMSVIAPGKSGESKLVQRLTAEKKAMRMPPAATGNTVDDKQVDAIRRWIDQGAKWETHWSYTSPKRPEVPKVKNPAWVKNPIDNFVLARLEKEGLKPSRETDRATLLRRLSFDLTGLPPTPAEVAEFIADRTPTAYEKRVDKLLHSPHYGERMAMPWLDLARYADTHGYHIDSHRDMWPWRDWVIKAFNDNMPFDRFTVEQLAGDLLPNPSRSQIVATGFNRNHMINFEGGAIAEEYQTEYVIDRLETTANVWMGMTIGCARCHDHKYDPIRQKDFYSFFAFFNTLPEKGLDGRKGNAEPMLELPDDAQKRNLDELKVEIAARSLPEELLAIEQVKWEKTQLARMPLPPRTGLDAHYEFDGNLADTSGGYHHGKSAGDEPTYPVGTVGKAVDFNGRAHAAFPGVGDFDSSTPFALAMWVKLTSDRDKGPMNFLQKSDAKLGRRGYEIEFDEAVTLPGLKRGSHMTIRLVNRWPDNAIEIRTRDRIVYRDWYQVAVNYDGSGKARGLQLFLNGKPEAVEFVSDSLSGTIKNGSPLEVGNLKATRPFRGQLDDLRIYNSQLAPAQIHELAVDEPVRSLLATSAKRSREQKDRLRDYYMTYGAEPEFRATYKELHTLRQQRDDVENLVPTVMVMEDMDGKRRDNFILARGDYRNKTEKVTAEVPSMLPPMAKDAPRNRLGLAEWLVDPGHPLTARVAVNRYWQLYFGTGIVKTAEDFGSQGEAPSHPELLDWLATEFVRTRWDVRAMQRLIVTSTAYRQSSRVTPELRERDPENRLFARMSRFRLPAEMVRDNALAVSGLLNAKIGGPSVFPYQPPGIWEDIAFGAEFSAQHYTPDHGDKLYRRGMYSFWKRTMPPPALNTFDAPDREKCTARRLMTNTPLQALVLMNDPTFVEAARVLAERTMKEGGKDDAQRIAYAFERATARKPSAREVAVLRDILKQKPATEKVIRIGESVPDATLNPNELAAWTTVASVILNLDETITKE